MIQPTFCNWTDTVSGIDKFHIEVYLLQTNAGNLLAETGAALTARDVTSSLNDFQCTLQTSGVYSIQLTVTDRAGNKARARKLLNFDGDSTLTVNKAAPVYVVEASPQTGYRWINSLQRYENGMYRLTFIWKDRYSSDARYASTWLLRAASWMIDANTPCDAIHNCIDDQYGNQFGMRSIAAITNTTGIVGFGVASAVDKNGGGGLDPTNYTTYSSLTTQATIQFPQLYDGETVVVWFRVIDATGNSDDVRLAVNIDTSTPNVPSDPTFTPKSINEFTST